LEAFDELLLNVIDRTIRFSFGDINAAIIYDYLEKKGCNLHEIPTKLNLFSQELRNVIGPGKGQLLGAAPILEETILELLYTKTKIKYDKNNPESFVNQVEKLREIYNNSQNTATPPTSQTSSLEDNSLVTQLPLQTTGGEGC
jgi:hypothetical protein